MVSSSAKIAPNRIATKISQLQLAAWPFAAIITSLLWATGLIADNQPPTSPESAGTWTFVEDTAGVGLEYTHEFDFIPQGHLPFIVGGVTIGDLNGDGWDDIFATTGYTTDEKGNNVNPNKLFIANGDGTFSENAAGWGLSDTFIRGAGPLFADFNGDGLTDLVIGGHSDVDQPEPNIHLLLNNGSGGLVDATVESGLPIDTPNIGTSAADFDQDGDLDLFLSHWNTHSDQLLFLNDGTARFTDVTTTMIEGGSAENTFTSSFADINGDGRLDLLLASDFGESLYFHQNESNFFEMQNSDVLTDQFGMGGAVGDYDNDGDLDWFVSSIFQDGSPAHTGNRLYENDGIGGYSDVSLFAGVREGFWGWGACFADFNHDTYLDIFHVNGWSFGVFQDDPARMFINNGDGSFTEQSEALNVADTGQGRSVICFDNDRDGDIDILIHNKTTESVFYRNELDTGNYLQVRLNQPLPNKNAIGATLRLTIGEVTQRRDVLLGSNFGASHPLTQHFGLGSATLVDQLEIQWPDGTIKTLTNLAVNQYLVIEKASPPEVFMEEGFE